ncbi:MAG: hypothetical protein R3C97_02040 [Geminicoccaceae bacterium]
MLSSAFSWRRVNSLDLLFPLLLVLAASGLAAAILNGPAFRSLSAAYYALDEVGYRTFIHIAEFRSASKVGDFRQHMIVLSFQLVMMIPLLWWYLRTGLPRHCQLHGRGIGLRILAPLSLFLAGGLVVAGYALSCFLSIGWMQQVCSLYRKEGFIDATHAVGFLAAAGMMLFGAWRYRQASILEDSSPFLRRQRTKTVLVLAGMAAVAFFIGMEEVSWGQTYLKWRTPELLMEINKQQETNVHNIFNRYLQPAYYLVGLGVFVGTVTAFAVRDRLGQLPIVEATFPPRALIGLAVWFPVASEVFIYASTEVFETLMTSYAVVYGLAVSHRAMRITPLSDPLPTLAGD